MQVLSTARVLIDLPRKASRGSGSALLHLNYYFGEECLSRYLNCAAILFPVGICNILFPPFSSCIPQPSFLIPDRLLHPPNAPTIPAPLSPCLYVVPTTSTSFTCPDPPSSPSSSPLCLTLVHCNHTSHILPSKQQVFADLFRLVSFLLPPQPSTQAPNPPPLNFHPNSSFLYVAPTRFSIDMACSAEQPPNTHILLCPPMAHLTTTCNHPNTTFCRPPLATTHFPAPSRLLARDLHHVRERTVTYGASSSSSPELFLKNVGCFTFVYSLSSRPHRGSIRPGTMSLDRRSSAMSLEQKEWRYPGQ